MSSLHEPNRFSPLGKVINSLEKAKNKAGATNDFKDATDAKIKALPQFNPKTGSEIPRSAIRRSNYPRTLESNNSNFGSSSMNRNSLFSTFGAASRPLKGYSRFGYQPMNRMGRYNPSSRFGRVNYGFSKYF